MVMRFSLLASKYPQYCALRAKSQGLALVWQLGHGILWVCLFSLPGVMGACWVSWGDPEQPRNVVWSVLAPVLVLAVIGVLVRRYAVRKGGASNASSD